MNKKKEYLLLFIILFLSSFIRLYQLSAYPPNLTGDELSIGYNAYSLLHRGVDEHGKSYPLWFEAYGEYKLPVYVYTTMVSVALFGNTDFAVRVPAAFFGTISVLLLYLIVKRLLSFDSETLPHSPLPLLSSGVFALLPWHVQLSRFGLESIQALFLYLLSILLLIIFFQKKKVMLLLLSVSFLVLTAYTYNAYRILAPLTLCVYAWIFLKQKMLTKKQLILLLLFSTILLLPVLSFTLTPQGLTRYTQTSAFGMEYTDNFFLSRLSDIFIFVRNYFSYISLPFLFTFNKDNIVYYVSSDFGLLFHWQLLFLVIGFLSLFQKKKKHFHKLIIAALLIIPIPAALTISPHPLRVLTLTPVLSVLIALGIYSLYRQKKFAARFLGIFFAFVAIYEGLFYQHTYTNHYASLHESLWGSARRITEAAVAYNTQYTKIVVHTSAMSDGNLTPRFYYPDLQLIFADDSWKKPNEWENERVLYIYRGEKRKPWFKKRLDDIHLRTVHKDTVAEVWEI